MKKALVILTLIIFVILNSGCYDESEKTDFTVKTNTVEIWQSSSGEKHMVLAVEVVNEKRKPMFFMPSDFDIVNEDGVLIDTMECVNAYPSTVRSNEVGVYYNTKVSIATTDAKMKLYAIPHIEAKESNLTNSQLSKLGVEGAETGGSKYSRGVIHNISKTTEYENVHVAVIGRTIEGKVVSVMTDKIDLLKPQRRATFVAKDSLQERDLGPDVVTSYDFFVYTEPEDWNI